MAAKLRPLPHRASQVNSQPVPAASSRKAFNREAFELFRRYLQTQRDALRAVDLDLAAFVCVTSIEALTHTAVLHRPEVLAGEAMETLVDEATRLVLGYLR